MDPDQGQSDQGPHCLPVCKNRFEKSARIFSRQHKQTTFSDAVFLGALRVKPKQTAQTKINHGRMGHTPFVYYPVTFQRHRGSKTCSNFRRSMVRSYNAFQYLYGNYGKFILLQQIITKL